MPLPHLWWRAWGGHLPLGKMIEEIVWFQAPNKVHTHGHPTPPPIDPTEQLLLRSYWIALSQLWSGYSSRVQSYRHSVSLADDSTCPNCHSTDHMVAHLLRCPSHPMELAAWDMWVAPLQVAQFLARLPHFGDLPPLQIYFNSFPLGLTLISPLVRSSSPRPLLLSNNNNQLRPDLKFMWLVTSSSSYPIAKMFWISKFLHWLTLYWQS